MTGKPVKSNVAMNWTRMYWMKYCARIGLMMNLANFDLDLIWIKFATHIRKMRDTEEIRTIMLENDYSSMLLLPSILST